ncbi:DUF192 domain-containing protein [Pelotomaculum propionicicum]|uniref:DUF192 domain-containing protein n=1 Tax=Pelotomaculum propionicicum TaxID=258475 RepID=A0A4Y7RQF5_9FIRM|nr:DUF192 domain-containing protein [Pelotomaculum propionicicum]NLI13848.1 DUF192 domain-containing protein [Peptococcaceae bacterium]TEB10949.1 hypothetical protein Pmgp_01964 [Pelotomaculum propionicicum]
MQLINKTNGNILANNVEMAGTFMKRLKGLMGRPYLSKGGAMILFPCSSIHTFFMNFPIDALFVDRNSIVIKTIENMKPSKISPVIKKSYMVVELPAGSLSSTRTSVGHHLEIIKDKQGGKRIEN